MRDLIISHVWLNFSETPDKKKQKLVPAPGDPSHVRDTMSSLGVSQHVHVLLFIQVFMLKMVSSTLPILSLLYFSLQLSLSHAFLFKIIVLNWLKYLFYCSSTQSSRDISWLSGESSFQTSQVETLQSASASAADQTKQSIDYIPPTPPTPPTPNKPKVARVSPHTEVTPPHYSFRPRKLVARYLDISFQRLHLQFYALFATYMV